MQSDPQDQQGPVSDGSEVVDQGPSSGPGSSPSGGAEPRYPVPAADDAPANPVDPPPPQMPGAPGPSSGYVPPPRMPGGPVPAWDASPPAGEDGTAADVPSSDPAPAGDPASEPSLEAAAETDAYAQPPASSAAATTAGSPPARAAVDPPPGADPGAADDWLGKICPYLISEDGTYRSTQPDEGHRCTAQEPNGSLPLAFQERFCLSDRHVRCEMYKYAQQSRSAALEEGGVASEQVQGARFKPAVRSVPVASDPETDAGSGSGSRRPAFIAAGALGGLVLLVLVTLLLSGGGEDSVPGAADGSASPMVEASPAAQPTDEPPPDRTDAPDAGGTADPAATQEPSASRQDISYQVQEGEALLRIADNFGTSRRRIINANEGMADKQPYVVPGDIIIVPASAALTIEELESFPGYLGPAE